VSGFEEYLINGDDLSAEQRDRMSQAVLGGVQRDAVRFQTDIPELADRSARGPRGWCRAAGGGRQDL
jgi:hypothetical protein